MNLETNFEFVNFPPFYDFQHQICLFLVDFGQNRKFLEIRQSLTKNKIFKLTQILKKIAMFFMRRPKGTQIQLQNLFVVFRIIPVVVELISLCKHANLRDLAGKTLSTLQVLDSIMTTDYQQVKNFILSTHFVKNNNTQ